VIKLIHFLSKIVLVLSLLNFFSLYNYGKDNPEMTAQEVYQMIIKYGFYCEIVKGSGFHGEGLKGMKVPKDFIFKGKRVITAETKAKNFLETKSVHQEKKKQEEMVLGWPLQVKNQCSFQTADGRIKILNNSNTDKNKKWRIPTIMELFSIIQQNAKNHFPPEFKFPKDETLTFWTSTPVKKGGTFLEYDKNNKAYFVVQSSYIKKDRIYSLSFGFQNIKGENEETALLLPVFSDKVYTYQAAAPRKAASTTPNVKLPGFDDNVASPTAPAKKRAPVTVKPKRHAAADKIPGFDDVPAVRSAAGTPRRTQPTIKISLFPHLMADAADDSKKKLLDHINDQVKQDIDALKKELKMRYNRHLIVDKMDPFDRNDMPKISQLYYIVSDENLSESETISQIKNHIMIPLGIDIILTIKHSLNKNSGIENMKPMVIDSLHNKIDKINLIHNIKEQRYDNLKRKVKDMMKEIFFTDSGK